MTASRAANAEVTEVKTKINFLFVQLPLQFSCNFSYSHPLQKAYLT